MRSLNRFEADIALDLSSSPVDRVVIALTAAGLLNAALAVIDPWLKGMLLLLCVLAAWRQRVLARRRPRCATWTVSRGWRLAYQPGGDQAPARLENWYEYPGQGLALIWRCGSGRRVSAVVFPALAGRAAHRRLRVRLRLVPDSVHG